MKNCFFLLSLSLFSLFYHSFIALFIQWWTWSLLLLSFISVLAESGVTDTRPKVPCRSTESRVFHCDNYIMRAGQRERERKREKEREREREREKERIRERAFFLNDDDECQPACRLLMTLSIHWPSRLSNLCAASVLLLLCNTCVLTGNNQVKHITDTTRILSLCSVFFAWRPAAVAVAVADITLLT